MYEGAEVQLYFCPFVHYACSNLYTAGSLLKVYYYTHAGLNIKGIRTGITVTITQNTRETEISMDGIKSTTGFLHILVDNI